jgi:hypothetical protein
MKRREFLGVSAGLAGTLLPVLRANARPCPPPTLSVAGGGSTTTTCPSGSAPAWFEALPDRAWTKIASASGRRLVDVGPQPPLTIEGRTLDSIITSWTGACVDQTRGELLMAANGGHAAYAGNECYILRIRSDTPRWHRLNDPTPASHVIIEPASGPAQYADGRMRSVHNWNRMQFHNGKVWHPSQDAYYSPTHSVAAVWSFNRDSLGDDAAGWPAPWRDDKGPWTSHGLVGIGSASFIGGPSALDRVGNKIWSFPEANGGSFPYWSVDTRTGAIQTFTGTGPNPHFGGQWAIVAHDLRILVVSDQNSSNVFVMDLTNPQAGVTARPTSGGQSGLTWFGGVYHERSKAILTYEVTKLGGGNIRKLKIPTRSDGKYDPAGSFEWSTISPAGGGVVPTVERQDYAGTYSKFNIVEDMGNGQSCLVPVTGIADFTYVYKVPSFGV